MLKDNSAQPFHRPCVSRFISALSAVQEIATLSGVENVFDHARDSLNVVCFWGAFVGLFVIEL